MSPHLDGRNRSIPFKDSLDNHQFYNADYFYKKNACWLIEQQDLNSEKLFDLIKELIILSQKPVFLTRTYRCNID